MKPRTLGLILLSLGLASSAPTLAAKEACLPNRGRIHGTLETKCQTLTHEGRERTYRVYVPQRLHEPVPLIFVLHGGGGSGANMELMTRQGFNRAADRDGAIVVYPDGVGRNWNDGRTGVRSKAMEENVDDVGFFRALVRELSAR